MRVEISEIVRPPAIVITAPITQAHSASDELPVAARTRPGLTKTPEPITQPVTIEAAVSRPTSLERVLPMVTPRVELDAKFSHNVRHRATFYLATDLLAAGQS